MDSKKDEILKRRSKLSSNQRELLEKRLRGEVDSRSRLEVIPRRSQTTPAPLSFAQQRLWFLHQLDPSNPSYNELASIQLTGALNVVALEQSLNEIVRRHEALRTTFEMLEGQAVQVIHPTVTVTLPVVNLSQLQETKRKAEVEWVTTEVCQKPFDMASGSLFRLTLLQTGELEYLLLFVIHHIAVDGWSIGVLFQELAVLYKAFSTGKTSPLPELCVQYADFAVWQRQWMQRELQKTQLSYWKQQLAGVPDVLALPTDHPRPAVQSFRGAIASFKLSPSLSDMLRSLSNREGGTLFMTLLAAFQSLLYRYTGQEDICIGSPIANRNQTETHGLIGCFVNTLLLRTHLSGNPSFLELLNRVREVCVGAYAHADIPFEQLVEELQPERNLSHMPLFQVAFAWQEDFQKDLKLSGLTLNLLSTHSQTAKFDLTLHVVDAKPELKVLLEYNTDLFNAKTITRMGEHFRTLLEGIVAYPQARLSDLPLLTAVELHQQLVEWNDTSTNYPADACIHELFEAQVERSPDAIAVVYEDEQLTYRELNARANQLAHYLRSLGVGPEVLVGICVERSPNMVVGLLGILKVGGAYIPLDPAYPRQRLAFMLSDAQPAVLLSQERLVERLPEHSAQVVCLDSDWHSIAHNSQENPVSTLKANNQAYVIYTSGSTGKPKAVVGLHQGAVNRFHWMWQTIPFTAGEVCCQKTSLNFVDSVWEIFGPLLQGIPTVIVPDRVVKDLQQFVATLASNHVTRLVVVPSLLRVLLNTYTDLQLRLPQLKLWISSGEALSIDLLVQFRQNLADSTLLNLYGSSEVSADVTCYSLSPHKLLPECVSIGCPIANMQIYVLDARKQPVPIGVPGELHIGGDGLARGYLNRPELTAEKFIPNPFSDHKSAACLYKTGDLVRYLPNGEIEYIGRIDHQVKVRGFRIELGEIEAAISQHSKVRETVVVVRSDEASSQRIVAYVVLHTEQTLTITELRDFLELKLPNYMLPAAFVMLEALPLTPNGKVDRKALRAPEVTQLLSESDFIAPSTPIEQMLALIWAEVLGIEKVGIHNNFFTLGGHSLLVTRVISKVRQVFQLDLPIRRLFEQPTIAGLAKDIEKATKADLGLETANIERISRSQELPLSFAQQRLWFLAQLEPNSPFYNISAAVRLQGQLNLGALQQSFNEILRRHEALRTNFQTIGGQPVAVISSATPLLMPLFDISELPLNQKEPEVRQLVYFEAQQSFDLSTDPLLRVKLLRLGKQEHIILLTMHHIASDGWSIGVLVSELAILYQAFYDQQPSALAELPIQYVDFAAWQRQWLQAEVLQSQISYWKKQLEGAPGVLELPTDYPRPAVETFGGATYLFKLSQQLSAALTKLSQQQGSTLFMTLLAAFQTLLSRYTGQEDIVIGSPIANRNRIEIEGLIGFFVNTLVLRIKLADNPTFEELLTRVREVALGAYAHQDLPFEQLVEELKPQRSLSHTPLFQVMFVLQNAPMSALELPGLTLSPLESDSGTAKFDLTLYMTETEGGLVGSLEYNTDLFKESTISRMAGHLQTLLSGIVANPQQHLWELPLLTEVEKALLVEWNDTRSECPIDQCIHQLFETQVERTPDAVAVVFEHQQLTYCELNARANQLAHHLQKQGVEPEVLVGICMEPSLDVVIGMLGILKAGYAYVPLDPTYPQERLTFILEDAQVPLLLTQTQLVEPLPQHKAKVVCLDADWKAIAQESEENPVSETGSHNLAYVIYTSGSTGKPKGVQIPHSALSNFLQAMRQTLEITEHDTLVAVTTISFDIAALELFLPITVGVRLVVVSREVVLDGVELSARLANFDATVMQATPATWRLLLGAGWQGNNQLKILCGGEALPWNLANQLQQRCACLWNLYGPTETTIWSAVCRVVTESGVMSIGRPIANTQFYILDRYGQLVPVGVPGELHIGGAGLARGYLNRPELTAQKFIPNPFGDKPAERLYKTGDLVRYLPDDNLEFLGRIDHQVKIRGFRIEMGEIEAILNQHPGVQETAVVTREDETDNQRLVAYLVQNPQYQAPGTHATEWQTEQISQWNTVWENNYSKPLTYQDPRFNISGWKSSYTGFPIPEEEMREWVDNTVERILSWQPTRVLEIGCGTGLLLFRIAPYCTQYQGTDFSPASLDYIQQQLMIPGQDLPQVTLCQRMADNFEGIEAEAFDAVIINSVVQYFPSIDYLLRVLEGALKVVKPGGFIFLGDVRSLPLLEAFHTSVLLHQASSSLSITQLQQRVQKRIAQEQELVIDPELFIALKHHLPKIAQVYIQPKRGHYHNELTKFRYDAIVQVGSNADDSTEDIPWLDWQQQKLTFSSVRQLLMETAPDILGLRCVPNARLLGEVKALELLASDKKPKTAGELQDILQQTWRDIGADPENLWNLSNELPYTVNISWSGGGLDGRYDVVFRRRTTLTRETFAEVVPSPCEKTSHFRSWHDYANKPLQEKLTRQLELELRSHLKKKLPNYMAISTLVFLEAFPLTPNGKVDRRALPLPEGLRPELEAAYVSPRTEVERTIATIWQKILNVKKVGIHDNFFDLGGHSLLLVQVHSQLRQIFQTDLSMIEMFRYPTISSLTEYLSRANNQPSFNETDCRTEKLKDGQRRLIKRLKQMQSDENRKGIL